MSSPAPTPAPDVSTSVAPACPSTAVGDTLHLGDLAVWPPVVLAPMAGVTNAPFRTLCRRHGGGLYVSEMVGARGLIEGNRTTRLKASFGPGETPRSIQLYATDPTDAARAAALLVRDDADGDDDGPQRVDHIDLNFGCPSPKVTRHGGGAALPWRTDLFAAIVGGVVANAGDVPVTIKLRTGIDDDHLTYLEAARAAQDLGVAAVALHARTARQRYGPPADWSAIATLVDAVDLPVLGNGDIWEAADALAMVERTGCAGVVVGRGCLGRPWLFRDLQAAFAGEPVPAPPDLGEVADLFHEHAQLLTEAYGEIPGLRELRKHTAWYLQGFPVGSTLRRRINEVDRLEDLCALLDELDRSVPFDESFRRHPRGHTTRPSRVKLPHGWLDRRTSDDAGPTALADAAAEVVSGG